MAVDYNDDRFTKVENEKNEQLKQTENTYNQMINDSNSYYQAQINASKDWQNAQTKLQQEQTNFAIDKINQQKEQIQKDYVKEQKGAYTDYQKATNQFGVNAEKLAVQGLNHTGYSESTRTNAYNTYQNRYSTARESYNNAILNYDNAIKEAQLANNSTLAQIAYESLQKQLELSLDGFQYKNTLVLQKVDALNSMNDRYYNRYQDVLNQINTENALTEQIRQYNESLAFQNQQAAQEQANWEKQYALSKSNNLVKNNNSTKTTNNYKQTNTSNTKSNNTEKLTNSETPKNYEVNTPYFQGDMNKDVKKYGSFSNGYQPKGISGHGEVSETGKKETFETQTLSGEKKIVTQNIWKTPDGKKWLWDGRYNQYIEYV